MRLAILGLFTACGPNNISTFDHNGVDREYVCTYPRVRARNQAHCYSISTAMGARQMSRWIGLTCVSLQIPTTSPGLSTRRSDEWVHPLELSLPSPDNKSTSDDFGFLNALVDSWSPITILMPVVSM